MSREPGTLTQDVRGRRTGAWLRGDRSPPHPTPPDPTPLAAGSPRGIFLPGLLYGDSLEPWSGSERLGGRPFVPPSPPVRGAGDGRASVGARLRFSLSFQSGICTAGRRVRSGWAWGCRPGLGEEQLPGHPAVAGFLGGRTSRRRPLAPLHALSLCSAPDLGAARLGARSRVGRGRSRRKDRLISRPSSRRPRGDRAAGETVSAGVGHSG